MRTSVAADACIHSNNFKFTLASRLNLACRRRGVPPFTVLQVAVMPDVVDNRHRSRYLLCSLGDITSALILGIRE